MNETNVESPQSDLKKKIGVYTLCVVIVLTGATWGSAKAYDAYSDWQLERDLGKLEGENIILIEKIKERKAQNEADWKRVESNRSKHAAISIKLGK